MIKIKISIRWKMPKAKIKRQAFSLGENICHMYKRQMINTLNKYRAHINGKEKNLTA